MTSESEIEKYLVDLVEMAGGEVRKVKWIGRRGAPDRLVMLSGVHFVELKAPGKKPEPHQIREHDRMRAQGVDVYVLDTYDAAARFVERILPQCHA